MSDANNDSGVVAPLNFALDQLRVLRTTVEAGDAAPRAVLATLGEVQFFLERALARIAGMSGTAMTGDAGAAARLLIEQLTPRERLVLDAVVDQGTTARAAAALGMSETTLSHHRSNILRKLNVASFPQAAHLLGVTGRGRTN